MTTAARTRRRPPGPTRRRSARSTPGGPHYHQAPHLELDHALARALELLDAPQLVRREATRLDPLLFAVVYFPHHLRSELTGDAITLSSFHLELCRYAARTLPLKARRLRQHRDAFVAPREAGKSTWLYLILVAWAAAHGWRRFVVAMADTSTQARDHLETLRGELRTNDRLRADFPDLCAPELRPDRQLAVADRHDMIRQRNGFKMAARGADKGVLGVKVGRDRPDWIVLDDIEPGEAQYSAYQARQRLTTLLDVVLPLNLAAAVTLSGTVTMAGSIVHQLVQHQLGEVPPDEANRHQWITDERFRVHYFPPLEVGDDGTERSLWPAKWPTRWLQSIRHTRSYRKNMENRPLAGDGDYWRSDLFRYLQLPAYGTTVLVIDPATTTKASSDWTGIAVVSRAPAVRKGTTPPSWHPGPSLHVRYATHVKLVGARLRTRVQAILAAYPDVRVVLVETNNGGEYLLENLAELGPPVRELSASEGKDVRAERALDYYERGKVFHAERFPILEAEQEGFPTPGLHDDVLDATVHGLLWLARRRRRGASVQRTSYV